MLHIDWQSCFPQYHRFEIGTSNMQKPHWDSVAKHFSLQALQKYQWVFKIINLSRSGLISATELSDFSYGLGVSYETSDYKLFYETCANDGNEMDFAQFLTFIYMLQTAGEKSLQFVQMIRAHAEIQFSEMDMEDESDYDSVDEDVEGHDDNILRAARQAKRAEKLEEAKHKSLQNEDPRPLQPYFPMLYAKYRPFCEGERPLINDGLMELVHMLARFNFEQDEVENEMDKMVVALKAFRQQEDQARKKYGKTFTERKLFQYIEQFRAVDNDDSGQVDEGELGELFKNVGIKVKPEKLSELFAEVDEDGSGEVDLDEFLGMLKKVEEGNASEVSRMLADASLKHEVAKRMEARRARDARAAEAAKRAALYRKFNKTQLSMFQEQFNAFDADGSGQIDFDELQAMVTSLGMDIKKSVLKNLLVSAGTAGSTASLTFTDFLAVMETGKTGPMGTLLKQISMKQSTMNEDRKILLKKEQTALKLKKEKEAQLRKEKATLLALALKTLTAKEVKGLEKGFKAIDVDGSDSIDVHELDALMKMLKMNMPIEQLRALMKDVDIDQSGELDFSEFLVLAAKAKENGRNASAFKAIVAAQNKAHENRAVREKLAKMKAEAYQKKLSSTLERENEAAARHKKLIDDSVQKRKNSNLKRAKQNEARQAQRAKEFADNTASGSKRLNDKDKNVALRAQKAKENKHLEIAKKGQARREQEARVKAKALLV